MNDPARPVVALRDVTEADLPILFEHQADPVSNRLAAFPARDREAFMKHWAGILENPGVATKVILADGRVAGNIVGFDMLGERQVGYWLGREFWGRGIASLALESFLEIETARPLHAHVAKHNPASVRVLQKCGFSIAGEGRVPFGPEGETVEEYILVLEDRRT